jgi:hypothetical protein
MQHSCIVEQKSSALLCSELITVILSETKYIFRAANTWCGRRAGCEGICEGHSNSDLEVRTRRWGIATESWGCYCLMSTSTGSGGLVQLVAVKTGFRTCHGWGGVENQSDKLNKWGIRCTFCLPAGLVSCHVRKC